jgi:hypothetical protein
MNSDNAGAGRRRKQDKFGQAKAMFDAAVAVSGWPLPNAVRARLKKDIFTKIDVAMSTVNRWLTDLESRHPQKRR